MPHPMNENTRNPKPYESEKKHPSADSLVPALLPELQPLGLWWGLRRANIQDYRLHLYYSVLRF